MSCDRYTLTVHIAEATAGDPSAIGGLGVTLVGHAWYSITDHQTKQTYHYGYTSNGVVDKDGKEYYDHFVLGDLHHYPMPIQKSQYYGLKAFGDHALDDNPNYNPNASALGHSDWPGRKYNLLNHNCIDFVIDALDNNGIETFGKEHDAFPADNDNLWKFEKIAAHQGNVYWLEELHTEHNKECRVPDQPGFGNSPYVKSPLSIDLDGDGIATTTLKDGVFFDIDADGFAEKMAWVNNKDALLVIDRNGNGVIDDVSELFGDNTKLTNGQKASNGFEALREFDSNHDGVIDQNDENWSKLKLWQDSENDGISQSDELTSFEEVAIKSIALNYQEQDVTDENGNQHLQSAIVHWKDGRETVIEDIWFQTNQTLTKSTKTLDLTDEEWEELANLPFVDGFGNVHHLWIAMSKDAVLKDMVKEYISADSTTRASLLDDLIYRWTGSDGVDPYSRDPHKAGYGHVMDARQLVSLEHLIGEDYLGTWCWGERDPNPHGKAAPLLIAEYNKFKDYVAAQISAQMDYPEIFAPVFLMQYDEETQSLHGNWSLFNNYIQEQFNQGEVIEIKNLLKIANDLGKYNPQYRQDYDHNLDELSQYNYELKAIIEDAWLIGTDGNDNLSGSLKDEIIVGSKGDDVLMGDGGNDEYRFDPNFGNDRIYDSAGEDKIVFGENIKPQDIELSRDLTSAYITYTNQNGEKNTIQIDNVYDFDGAFDNGFIESIQFADGTVWDSQTIKDKLLPKPTNGDDVLYYDQQDNIITPLAGNDTVYAGYGNDIIQLTAGNNTVYADDGNDMIISGYGNDYLEGGLGDDVYIFNRNFGQDRVLNFNPNQADNDVIQISGNLKQYSITRNENDLIIQDKYNQNNQITVQDYFKNDAAGDYAVQQINFNNISLNIENIKDLVQQPTWGNDVIYAYAEDSNLSGNMGDDRIVGNIGNDVLSGGVGFDVLEGGAGDDRLDGGLGNDTLQGDAGDDVLLGGAGSDVLHGGSGNDVMQGGIGNDVYVFNRGDGQDTISDTLGNDTLKIGANLQDLWFAKDGKNINISIIGTDDTITIENGSGLFNRIENIELEDGNSLNFKEMNNIINTQSHFANSYTNDAYIAQQMIEFNQNHGIL